jgi:outer membrane protein OmpA-like peptidoglycan-associated protein
MRSDGRASGEGGGRSFRLPETATKYSRDRIGLIVFYVKESRMRILSNSPKSLFLLAMLTAPIAGVAHAQQVPSDPDAIVVSGSPPADLTGLPQGPEVEGFISARSDGAMQVTTPGGERTTVLISENTRIRSRGGFLGLHRSRLASNQLHNGLPVSVKTVRWADGLVASQISLKSGDLKTAQMIHNGTDQRFTSNEAATEALRGRMGDIDQYNVKGTTTVTFDTGRAELSEQAKANLCGLANQAAATDNSLLLVVGYTDSTGSQELNQTLSEKRAGGVVNYLQQACGWKPYRMLTPTGMAMADPAASNDTEEGKAQNRRVTVSIMVSKAVDGF